MSLVTLTCAEPDFVASARLVAAIVTIALFGKSPGAVYCPAGEIVPTAALPPTAPFTLHVTAVFVVFVTSAAKICVFPNRTELVCGVSFTTMGEGGGGGGGPMTAPPPPQPSKQTPVASRSATPRHWESPVSICRRGRTARRKAVEWPRVVPQLTRHEEYRSSSSSSRKSFICYHLNSAALHGWLFLQRKPVPRLLRAVPLRDIAAKFQFQFGTRPPASFLFTSPRSSLITSPNSLNPAAPYGVWQLYTVRGRSPFVSSVSASRRR
jgi:hypothetical protein